MSNRVGQVASIINTDSASIKFPKAHELSISLFVRIRRYASNDNTVMNTASIIPPICMKNMDYVTTRVKYEGFITGSAKDCYD